MFGTTAHFSSPWERSSVEQPGRKFQMNATQLAKATKGAAVEELDVLVVGAGFAGLYQLDHLRRLGYNVKVFEAGSDIGGVWYWNCYPGARVDTYGPLYQFSSAELWRDWNYSEFYPSWEELAPISATSTRSWVSAVTSGSTPASREQSSTPIATSGSCRPATAA
jgi:phytoene dehydrogenase-like protein